MTSATSHHQRPRAQMYEAQPASDLYKHSASRERPESIARLHLRSAAPKRTEDTPLDVTGTQSLTLLETHGQRPQTIPLRTEAPTSMLVHLCHAPKTHWPAPSYSVDALCSCGAPCKPSDMGTGPRPRAMRRFRPLREKMEREEHAQHARWFTALIAHARSQAIGERQTARDQTTSR